MNLKSKSLITLCALSAMIACGSDTAVGPGDGGGNTGPKAAVLTGNIATDRTLSKDTVYTLSGFVKVRSGATLHIPAGTKIVGDTLVNGSSLWILPGGKISALGDAANPIVFTSARSAGNRKPGDWGGIIIIGKAIANRGCPNTANTNCITTTLTEGPAGGVQNTAENYAGGTDASDNSGTMRYVRAEFAGYAVQLDQELNTFSFYAVGRGTTLEYLESMSGLDDSFEWFGGSVDGRYLVSYDAGDDHFDWTEGYNGRNQFLIAYQTFKPTPQAGAGFAASDPRGFEGDGCETTKAGCADFTTRPYSQPVFANFTLVGPGPGTFTGVSDANASVIRRGSGGTLINGIIARWQGIGLDVRDAQTNTLRTLDSLIVTNVLLTENAGGNFDPAGTNFGQATNFPGNEDGTMSTTGLFTAVPPAGTDPSGTTLDWSLSANSAARVGGLTALPTVVSARVQNYFGAAIAGTAYRGASDPAGAKWWTGWTSYARN
jgi:hypothetical protein